MFARCRLLAPLLALAVVACSSRPDLDTLAAEGRHAEIVEALGDEERLAPSDAVRLGEAHLELGDLDAATREFNLARVRAGHTNPIAFRALFGLGNVSMLKRDGTTALYYFEEAHVHAPTALEREAAVDAQDAARELIASEVARAAEFEHLPPGAYPDPGIPDPPQPFDETRDPPPPPGRGLVAPRVLPRSAWGARRMNRADADPMNGISRITVHHTADANPVRPASQDVSARRMRGYQAFHMDTRKWADIGYHFVIDPSGRIWEGRPLRWQGAHAGSPAANRHNVGVCLMGNFELGPPTAQQQTTLKTLVRWLVREFRVPEKGLSTHQAVEKAYQLDGTLCPGRHLSRYVETLRRELRSEFAARGAPDLRAAFIQDAPCPCGRPH